MGYYWDKITNATFDRLLEEIVAKQSAWALLQIPGVYEALVAHFNNEVMGRAEAENEVGDGAGSEW